MLYLMLDSLLIMSLLHQQIQSNQKEIHHLILLLPILIINLYFLLLALAIMEQISQRVKSILQKQQSVQYQQVQHNLLWQLKLAHMHLILDFIIQWLYGMTLDWQIQKSIEILKVYFYLILHWVAKRHSQLDIIHM